MKYMLFSIFILLGIASEAQKKVKISKNYINKTDIRVRLYNFTESCSEDIIKIAPKHTIFEVIEENIEGFVVKFWQKNDTLRNSTYIDYTDASLYFLISKSTFLQNCYLYDPKVLTFGAVVVPIKLRFGGKENKTFEFAKDISIGNAIGWRKSFNQEKGYSINYLASVGITSVTLDSVSTMGYIKTSQDMAAFTPSFGIVFEFNQAQIGAFVGVDLLGKGLNKYWIYQKSFSPWVSFGIGIGFQIFKSQVTDTYNTWKKEKP